MLAKIFHGRVKPDAHREIFGPIARKLAYWAAALLIFPHAESTNEQKLLAFEVLRVQAVLQDT